MDNQKRSKHAAVASWLGCCAVAVSLVVAGPASAIVTVTVATNDGVPGGALTLTMSLSREQTDGAVGNVNADLIFDTAQMELIGTCSNNGSACQLQTDCAADACDPNVTNPPICNFSPGPCQIDPRLTQQTFSVLAPCFQNVPAANRRIRLAVLNTSFPVVPITDGNLGTCSFQVQADASPGPLTLYNGACSNSGTACQDATQCPASEFCVVRFNVGDTNGQTIPGAQLQVTPGVIVEASPTPTGPTPTSTPTGPTATPTSTGPTTTPTPTGPTTTPTRTGPTATPTPTGPTRTPTVTVGITATPTPTRTASVGSPTATVTPTTGTPTNTVPPGSPSPTRTTGGGGGGGGGGGCNCTIAGSETGMSGSLAWLALPVALLVRRRLRR